MNDSAPRTCTILRLAFARPGRGETDPIGAIEVPADRCWGRRRSAIVHFWIGDMPTQHPRRL